VPAKNSRKIYLTNGFYHVYNRGVEKRIIFVDEQDLNVFLGYLKDYLEPVNRKELLEKLSDKNLSWAEKEKILKKLRLNNFAGEVELLAFCLMPNHFHFLLKQNKENSMDRFCNSLFTRYATYFNKKHKRVGKLFQDVYKAVLVETEGQLLHLSRYIHRNPLGLGMEAEKWQNFYTSLPAYLGKSSIAWVKPEFIASYFSKTSINNSYLSFVTEAEDLGYLKGFIIEDLD